MCIKYAQLLRNRNAPWSLGLRPNAKDRSWRLSVPLAGPPDREGLERVGRTCAQLWDMQCLSLRAESSGAVLSTYQMCSFVNFTWKLYTEYNKATFVVLRGSYQLNQKEPRIWEKSFILMRAAPLKESVKTMSLALEIWAESRIGIKSCWQETGVPEAQGTREMWAQILSTSNTLSYRSKDYRPVTFSLVRNQRT